MKPPHESRLRAAAGHLAPCLLAIAVPAAAAAQGLPATTSRFQLESGDTRFQLEADDTPFQFEGEVLDRQDLVEAVLARNRELAAARWAVEAARAHAEVRRELPDMTASYGFAPASPFVDDTRYGQIAQISQALPWPGTLSRRGEEADALANATAEDLEALRRELALIASQAFDDYRYVERARAINDEHLELMRGFQEVATTRYAAGLAPQQAPLAAEVEVAHLAHRDLELATDRQTLLSHINALLHRDPRAPVPPPSLRPATMPEDPGMPVSQLVQLALARRPEVAAARARVTAGQSGVELARLEGYPSFQPMSTFNSLWGPGAYRWTVTLGVSLPVWRDRIRAGVARATSTLSEQQERLAAIEDRIGAEVSSAAARFEESRHVLELYDGRLVPAARDQATVARVAFESGQVDFLAVIDAERGLRNVELGLAGARADARRRFAALQRALGVLPGEPWPPSPPSLQAENSDTSRAPGRRPTPRRRNQ